MTKVKGSCQLTDREKEILSLLADGCSNKEIADILYITIRTVKFHTNNIYAKLKVNSRTKASAWFWKNGETVDLNKNYTEVQVTTSRLHETMP